MHEVLVNRLGGLSLPRKSVVRLTDRPDMTLDVYCGHKTTIQQQQQPFAHMPCVIIVPVEAWQIYVMPDRNANEKFLFCFSLVSEIYGV